jgi:hypothetical protein
MKKKAAGQTSIINSILIFEVANVISYRGIILLKQNKKKCYIKIENNK